MKNEFIKNLASEQTTGNHILKQLPKLGNELIMKILMFNSIKKGVIY